MRLIIMLVAAMVAVFGLLPGMAALTASRTTRTRPVPPLQIAYPVNALSQIYKGGLVNIDSTGNAVAATDSASDNSCAGVAAEDALGGANDGDTWVEVLSGAAFDLPATSITQAMVGDVMYVENDNEFDDAAGPDNDIPAGILTRFISTTRGELFIPAGGSQRVS